MKRLRRIAVLLTSMSVVCARVAPAILVLASLCGCGRSQSAAIDGPQIGRTLTETSREISLDLGGGLKMDIVLIPAGTFVMGSDKSPFDSEKPAHKVTISRPLYLGKYPVTQEEWQAVMGSNPSRFKGASNPVDGVSWRDAQDFCRKLGERSGRPIRLPTEAEWEFACRAGSTMDYGFDDSGNGLAEYAWYENDSGGTTHAVGEKKPNPWGLYDMHGNVWEWCHDWYEQNYYASSPRVDPQGPARSALDAHVLRGGAWHTEAMYCRPASRGGDFPCGEGGPDSWSEAGHAGFRIAVPVTDDTAETRPQKTAKVLVRG